MSSERIRTLLAELREETRSEGVDADTRSALRQLDADIHRLLDENDQVSDTEPLIERAQLLEAEFAASHPTFERFMREVVDALVKIGL